MKKCLICDKKLYEEPTMIHTLWGIDLAESDYCLDCLMAFEPLIGPNCLGCGRKVKEEGKVCGDCGYWKKKQVTLLKHQALYVYNEQMKAYMAKYKFIGDYRMARLFQKRMHEMIRQIIKKEKIDYVVPIPVSKTRYGTRGFNQVVPYLPPTPKVIEALKVRKNKGKDQSEKSRQARLHAKQPFILDQEKVKRLKGKRVLLVDDVYTTERTLYHAQARLLEAGATFVTSCSLAR
ncbi:ComF family protein [Fructobacillus sp. M2-14]|uniref:ComF family protein n=1 Tax=Fructobacillus broussonetiae TaxID=2713173 RepID=A0ABS5R161_9LACO|nr:phosphoribosyltransferase family protein [Fructobacillus broussonetiae]MBS9338962.1 ComF family protein [Fructobacillus broussonetiae]